MLETHDRDDNFQATEHETPSDFLHAGRYLEDRPENDHRQNGELAKLKNPNHPAPEYLARCTARGSKLVEYRKNKRKRSLSEEHNLIDADAGHAEDWVIRRQTQQHVQDALKQLQEDELQLVLMRHFEEWTLREIAQHAELTINQVRRRLQAAENKLRHILAPYYFGTTAEETKHEKTAEPPGGAH